MASTLTSEQQPSVANRDRLSDCRRRCPALLPALTIKDLHMALPTSYSALAPAIFAPRRFITLCAMGFATLIATFTLAFAQAADPLIAKVNGVEIRHSDLTVAEEDIGRDIPANDEAAKRDYLVNYLTDMLLIAKAAEAKKIPDSPEFKQRLAFVRNKALMETLLGQESKAAAS